MGICDVQLGKWRLSRYGTCRTKHTQYNHRRDEQNWVLKGLQHPGGGLIQVIMQFGGFFIFCRSNYLGIDAGGIKSNGGDMLINYGPENIPDI